MNPAAARDQNFLAGEVHLKRHSISLAQTTIIAFNLKGLRAANVLRVERPAAYLYANVDRRTCDPRTADCRASPATGRARPVVVGLVQINNSFSGQNYLPYSVALLQTYVQKMAADPGRYRFLPPLYKRVRIADAVEALKGADLVGFSTYVWNGRISLEIARRLKALKPGHRQSCSAARTCRTSPRPSCGPIPRSTSPSTTRVSGPS